MEAFNAEQRMAFAQLLAAMRQAPADAAELDRAVIDLGGLAILSADADKIKEYVFESARLPEVRGASMLLSELNWEPEQQGRRPAQTIAGLFHNAGLPTEDWLDGGCVLNHYGGSLLAIVPLAMAETLTAEVEALYPAESGAATITSTWMPVTARALGDSFDQVMAVQSARLRRRKEQRERAPFFETPSYARRCQSCGKRPASTVNRDIAEQPRYLCWVCDMKAGQSREQGGKRLWLERFEEYLSHHPGSEMAQGYGYSPGQSLSGAHDIGIIAAAARESSAKRHVGFIFADGNGVGEKVEKSPTMLAYAQRSRSLFQTMNAAVFEALAKNTVITQSKHPWEIITIGGDDALLIVPADTALAVAHDIAAYFEQHLPSCDGWHGEHPTLSAGVVIADEHNPVYFLRELAESLLKEAKRAAQGTGTVDFLVLKSQSMTTTSLSHLRHSPPLWRTDEATKEHLLLTERPLSLSRLTDLLWATGRLKKERYPRSQLYALQDVLQTQGRLASTIYYLYQRARQERHKAVLDELEARWQLSDPSIAPWRAGSEEKGFKEYRTVFQDIVEVYDFVAEVDNAPAD